MRRLVIVQEMREVFFMKVYVCSCSLSLLLVGEIISTMMSIRDCFLLVLRSNHLSQSNSTTGSSKWFTPYAFTEFS